jgi:transcriptional regulator with XRE-family HTH domain
MDTNNNTGKGAILDKYVGQKIMDIRKARKMSRRELGNKLGTTADGINKIENGIRHPREDRLNEVAAILDVNPMALGEPSFGSEVSVMHAFFDLAGRYGLKPMKMQSGDESRVCLVLDDDKSVLQEYLRQWFKIYTETQNKLKEASSADDVKNINDEYNEWVWKFPEG